MFYGKKIDSIEHRLDWLVLRQARMVTATYKLKESMQMWKDEILKEVRETKDASQALMKALADVRADLAELASRESVSPGDVAEVVKELDDNQKEMIAAVFEGTPAEPTPEEEHAATM